MMDKFFKSKYQHAARVCTARAAHEFAAPTPLPAKKYSILHSDKRPKKKKNGATHTLNELQSRKITEISMITNTVIV